jgi:DNA (cytosine-5)-methyltransferase 1
VSDQVCLEPCAAFFLADARLMTGQQVLHGIAAATGWKMRRGDVDLVVGGPPCQGFSIAGKRSVYDPRNSLVFEFARLCVEMLPKTLCMENVPEIVNMITPDGELVIDRLTRATAFDWMTDLKLPGLGWNRG